MIPRLPVKAWIAVAVCGLFAILLIGAYLFSSRGVVKASVESPMKKAADLSGGGDSGPKIDENQEKIEALTSDIENSLKAKTQVPGDPPDQPASIPAANQQVSQLAYEQQYLKALQGAMTPRQDAPVSKGDFVLSFKDSKDSSVASNEPPEVQENPLPSKPVQADQNQDRGGFACGSQVNYWTGCLPEGTVIRAVTTNQLQGDFDGPLNARVTETVMSRDRKSVLIPAGTVVLGESGRVGDSQQARLAIVFHLLRLESDNAYHKAGWEYRLDKLQALSPDGSAGETANVNHHWASTLLAAGAFGALAGFSLEGTGSVLTNNGWGVYRQGLSEEMGTEGEQMMSHFLNRLPTLSVPVGRQVDVYLSKDLVMR